MLYSITNWRCATNTKLNPTKRAICVITNEKYKDHINPLFLNCKFLNIAIIYKLKLFKLMNEIHKNILTISDNTTFAPVTTIHRNHIRYQEENFQRKQISKQYIKDTRQDANTRRKSNIISKRCSNTFSQQSITFRGQAYSAKISITLRNTAILVQVFSNRLCKLLSKNITKE